MTAVKVYNDSMIMLIKKICTFVLTNTRYYFLPVLLLALSACASKTVVLDDELPQTQDVSAEEVSDLPKQELSGNQFYDLLAANVSAQYGDWKQAYERTIAVARSSQDYRLARNASVIAFRLNDYDKAVESAGLWLQLQPDVQQAKYSFYVAQMGANQVDLVVPELIKLIDGYEKGHDEGIKLVTGLVGQQKNAEASMQVMSKLMNHYPQSEQARASAAHVAYQYGYKEQASEYLDAALQLRPNWDVVAQLQVEYLSQAGKQQQAEELVAKFLKDNPKSIAFRKIHVKQLVQKKQFEEAWGEIQKVLKIKRNDQTAVYFAGILAEHLKLDRKAEKYFTKLLELDDKHDDARWRLAKLFQKNEQFEKSMALFKEIKRADLWFDSQIYIAMFLFELEGLDASLEHIDSIDPNTGSEYVRLALFRHQMLLRDNQQEEAFASLNEWMVSAPNNVDLLYARGMLAAELDDMVIMEQDMRAVLKQDPANADALNALGYMLADKNQRLEEAKQLITQALEIRPNDSYILDSMGWVLYRLQDYENALKYLQRALEQDQDAAEIAAHLGEVLWKTGEQEKALAVWQEAIQKDAENKTLNETMKRFEVEEEPEQVK